MSKEINYNKIPVHFCKTCLSLKVLKLESSNVDYCGKCGNTEISTSSLFNNNKIGIKSDISIIK